MKSKVFQKLGEEGFEFEFDEIRIWESDYGRVSIQCRVGDLVYGCSVSSLDLGERFCGPIENMIGSIRYRSRCEKAVAIAIDTFKERGIYFADFIRRGKVECIMLDALLQNGIFSMDDHFIRENFHNCRISPIDVYVTPNQVKVVTGGYVEKVEV